MRAVLLLLVAACAAPEPPRAPAPPTPMQQIEASRDLDGAAIGHAQMPTVVVVLASWCGPCRDELRVLESLRTSHTQVRWLAVNYKGHEEYAERGSPESIRALAATVPWLRVISADDALFDAVGAPSKIPTVIVYDSRGALAARYDRHERTPPTYAELDELLARLRKNTR